MATLPRAGDQTSLAFDALIADFEHFLSKEGQTVAGGFRADQGAAEVQALARQHAGLKTVGQALVLSIHVADFPPAHANVTGGNVGVFADMAIELGHEALAEPHDFAVALALGIEVAATLGAANGHAGQ